MYNRYIPNGASYTRIPQEDGRPAGPAPAPRAAPPPEEKGARKSGGLSALLRRLKLESLDTGDVLLLLILLLLFLEGDDLELLITLGLLLVMGLE